VGSTAWFEGRALPRPVAANRIRCTALKRVVEREAAIRRCLDHHTARTALRLDPLRDRHRRDVSRGRPASTSVR